jgi:peptidoglycan/LPS O-acetylase OafA/YrhL
VSETVELRANHAGLNAAQPVAHERRRSQNIPYLAGVDHLRGAAALLILYYHGIQLFSSQVRYGRMFARRDWPIAPDPFSALIAEGHTAVALFIVLSGFIFAFGATNRQVSYRQFLMNRFLRTYPLLLLLIIVGSAVHQHAISILPLLQTLLFGANLQGAQALGDFSIMFWSVSLEWQLYLLFPALMAILNQAGPLRLASVVGLLVVVRAVGYLQGMNPVDGLYSQLLGRVDQFMLGMIVGNAYAKRRHHPALKHVFWPALLLVLCGAQLFNQLGGWPRQQWWKILTPTLEGLLWACVVLGHVARVGQREQPAGQISRGIVAIGVMSYSIYLWHFVFIQIQRTQGWVPLWLEQPELNAALVVTLTTLPCTLAFSACSYQLFERPFMALRKRYVAARDQTLIHSA